MLCHLSTQIRRVIRRAMRILTAIEFATVPQAVAAAVVVVAAAVAVAVVVIFGVRVLPPQQ